MSKTEIDNTPINGRSRRLSIRIPLDLYDVMADLAKTKETSKGDIAVSAMRLGLNAPESPRRNILVEKKK